jgi:alanine racemase
MFKNVENLANKEVKIISEKFSINKISKLINTIPYEILTNLGKRYQRRYIL